MPFCCGRETQGWIHQRAGGRSLCPQRRAVVPTASQVMRRARLEQKKGSSWIGRRRISKARPIRPDSQDTTAAHPTPGGWPVRCCQEVRGFTLPARVSHKAQRVDARIDLLYAASPVWCFSPARPRRELRSGLFSVRIVLVYDRVSGLLFLLEWPRAGSRLYFRPVWLEPT